MKRKILALLLACMMVISMVPATVFAADVSLEELPDAERCTCETPNYDPEKPFQVMDPTCESWGYKAFYCKNTTCKGVVIELTDAPTGKHVDAADKETGLVDHKCDYCKVTVSECKDDDKNHKCDLCGVETSKCADADKNHFCDTCNDELTKCADENDDHLCDLCKAELTKCADANNDHLCDLCEAELTKCADADNDHLCDLCEAELTKCADADKNHLCDLCEKKLNECADADKNHFCDTCNKELTKCADEEVDKEGHKDHKCDICGTPLSACKDNPVTVKGAPATCCQEGYSYYVVCGVCGDVLVKPQVLAIDPNAHAHDIMNPTEHHDATCEEAEYAVYECTNGCGKEDGVLTLPGKAALGHDESGPAATCTTDKVCARGCGEVLEKAPGHTAGPVATCTTAQVCTVCNVELAPALGHDKSGDDATCTTDKVCARENCDEVLVGRLGHDWKDVAEKAPSIFEPGHSAGKECQREGCGAFEGSAFEAQLAEKVTFNYEVTAVNVTSGTITVQVYMAVKNGVRIEALQWSMNFDNRGLELVDADTKFQLTGLAANITTSETAAETGLVVVSAYAADDGLETYAATTGDGYAFATLTFKIKDGAKRVGIWKNAKCVFTRPDELYAQNGNIVVTDDFKAVEATVLLLGDWDGDSDVDVYDLAVLLRTLNALGDDENATVDYDTYYVFDMDHDGRITLYDLERLNELVVKQGPQAT